MGKPTVCKNSLFNLIKQLCLVGYIITSSIVWVSVNRDNTSGALPAVGDVFKDNTYQVSGIQKLEVELILRLDTVEHSEAVTNVQFTYI